MLVASVRIFADRTGTGAVSVPASASDCGWINQGGRQAPFLTHGVSRLQFTGPQGPGGALTSFSSVHYEAGSLDANPPSLANVGITTVSRQLLWQWPDLIGSSLWQLPPGANVLRASIAVVLRQSSSQRGKFSVFRLARSVNDLEVVGIDAQIAGLYTLAGPERAVLDTSSVQVSPTVTEHLPIDITSIVRAWVRGEPNYGLAIAVHEESSLPRVDVGSTGLYAPILNIEYTSPGSVASCCAQTSGEAVSDAEWTAASGVLQRLFRCSSRHVEGSVVHCSDANTTTTFGCRYAPEWCAKRFTVVPQREEFPSPAARRPASPR